MTLSSGSVEGRWGVRKQRKASEPRPLKVGLAVMADVYTSISGGRYTRIYLNPLDANECERLSKWLVGAAAWCREANR